MTLAPGTRLGAYDILGPLGAGGMGEVFRARDTRLGREVALKRLPADLARDPERLARFEREARLLAALDHPNIARLHGFEEADGQPFLCMELAEGEDLSARIERGAIPVDEALAIARQLAEAIESAHERGILHRDLKPANVKLGADNRVKVLDFGLARAFESEEKGSSPALTQSPTLTARATQAGVILGTAAYMSPEQARGKSVDKRADIWAFGAVLFEMLTGERLFPGETVTDTLASVLRQEIRWQALPATTTAPIRHLLARCLERDAKRRLRDIGEARIVIEEALSGGVEGPTAPAAGKPGRRPPLTVALGVGVAFLALGAAAGWMVRGLREAPPPVMEARWALAIPHGTRLSTLEYPQLAISEDGRRQVAVVLDATSTRRLLLRDQDTFEARLIPESERAAGPFLSPDGNWIGFIRDNSLFKLPVVGGPPVRLASTSGQGRGASWGDDGFVYYSPETTTGIRRVPEQGGEPEAVTELDPARNERTHRWPHALPGGDAVLFTSDTQASTEFYDDARIEAVRPRTGERRVLVEGASQAWYAPSGHLIYARGGSLYAVPFDRDALTVSGTPVQVASGVATDVGSGAVQFALAGSGAAIWTPGGTQAEFRLAWVDRQGAESSLPVPLAPYSEMALSPDGKRLALVGGDGGVADLWIADLDRGGMTRLTIGEFVSSPLWSPDSLRIAYSAQVKDAPATPWRLLLKVADGSREAEELVRGRRGLYPTSFTPDGRMLLYDSFRDDATARDIWALPIGESREPQTVISGPFQKGDAVVSPDGRWLAYVSDEAGQDSVYVRPFPAGEGRWQISTPDGVEPRWSHDGKTLFYRTNATLYRVPIQLVPVFSAGRPEPLFDRIATSGTRIHTYSPARDGERFATFRSSQDTATLRTLYFDPGFAARLSTLAAPR